MKRRLIRTLITGTVVGSMIVAPVYAAPQDDVKSLENQKSQAEAQVASVNQDLVDLLVEYEALQKDIENTEKKIDQVGKDLEAAEEKEKQQYEDMKLRIKYMYENGVESYLSVLVSATDFTDFVNKAEYVQKVNKYDRDMLDEYVETKNEIKDLKAGKGDMEVMAQDMEGQKANLQTTLTQMEEQIADFDTQLAAAREAAEAQVQEATNEADTSAVDEVIESVTEEDQNQDQEQDSSESKPSDSKPSSSKPSGGSSSSSKPGNASLGQQIANKGCEYIGNKYVYGGNSLTNGIDCSGFVQQIHKKFGISTPRSSSAIRSGGKAVSYADKLPGDVICYSGHVAIYIGNNTVVHASNSKPYPSGGIKTTSPANYRTVLAVRRYW